MPRHNYSRQRESIAENLMARSDHPTADMVYSDIRLIYPNISLGTVYRNLSLLAEENAIHKVITDDGILHFDCNTAPHNHFVCRCCGRVSDLMYPDTGDLSQTVETRFGCAIDHCDLTFYGLCRDCSSSAEKP